MVTKLLPNSPFSKTFDYYLKNPSQKVWITIHVSTFFVLVIALTFYRLIYQEIRKILNIRIIRKAQNIQNFQKTKKIQIILIIPTLKIPQPHNLIYK